MLWFLPSEKGNWFAGKDNFREKDRNKTIPLFEDTNIRLNQFFSISNMNLKLTLRTNSEKND